MYTLVRLIVLCIAVISAVYYTIISTLSRDLSTPIRNVIKHITPALLIIGSILAASWYFTNASLLRAFLPFKSNTARNIIAYTIWPPINTSIWLMGTSALGISFIDKLIYGWLPNRRELRIPYPIIFLINASFTALGATSLYIILSARRLDEMAEIMQKYLNTLTHSVYIALGITITLLILLNIARNLSRKQNNPKP